MRNTIPTNFAANPDQTFHTVVWAFFAACIIVHSFCGDESAIRLGVGLTTVLLECVVLLTNRGRCPLTDLAARYTGDRADNFDIYLPSWLARHNKTIFGSLFVAGELFVLGCWLRR